MHPCDVETSPMGCPHARAAAAPLPWAVHFPDEPSWGRRTFSSFEEIEEATLPDGAHVFAVGESGEEHLHAVMRGGEPDFEVHLDDAYDCACP